MLMRKFCFNKPFLMSLITAFLLLQWSATHIHLASAHEHDDSHHQHAVTAHQHQLATHHADVIDVASETLPHSDSHKVVEIDYVCTQLHTSIGEVLAFIPSVIWNNSEQQISFKSIVPAYQNESYQNYLQTTSVRLRAPPLFS